jgi:CRISPR-associated protein Cpf1
MKNLNDFTGLYPVSKTLRFELKPTEDFNWETFLESTIFKHDQERTEAYPIVKVMLDQFHKWFIEDALNKSTINWDALYEAYIAPKNEINSDTLRKEQDKIRKEIVDNYFKKHDWWKYISKDHSKLFKIELPALLSDDAFIEGITDKYPNYTREVLTNALEKFQNFSVYFGGYFKNRDNMYKSDAQGTSIANRIVNENFTKFADNIRIYNRLKENCLSELQKVELNLIDELNGLTFDKIFSPSYFNKCLTQKGIERLNLYIGGKTGKNKDDKVFGINRVGNEFLQLNKESKLKLKDLKMVKLYKQILSDREQPSFLPEQFSNENELIKSIEDFHNLITEQKLFERLLSLMGRLKNGECEDLNKIHIVGSSLTQLSKVLYSNWEVLGIALRNKFQTDKTKKDKLEKEKDIQEWIERKSFSLAQIIEVESSLQDDKSIKVIDLFTTFNVWQKVNEKSQLVDLIKLCKDDFQTRFKAVKDLIEKGEKMQGNESAKEEIKTVLDNYQNLLHVVKLLNLGKKESYLDKDETFYNEYKEILSSTESDNVCLEDIIPLYNKVRSFLTRKLGDVGKMLLKFDCSTLADGWDVGKESANNSTILIDNSKYYLIISNPENKPDLSNAITSNTNNVYKKIVYRQIADPTKDLPNLMVIDGKTQRKTGNKDDDGINRVLDQLKDKYLPQEINRIRKLGSYLKTSEYFNKKDSQVYLAYYMQRLIEYKQGEMEFSFKNPEEYDSYSDFLDDITKQKYSLSFVNVSKEIIRQWLSEGKLFLFQIYNKDFEEKATGMPNLHTLYWKELFSEENLKDVVYKLNGEAELFYRKKTEGKPFTHNKGDVLVNKTFEDGSPVEPKLYKEYVEYFTGKVIENQLSKEAKNKLHLVKTNKAKLDIIKDKRYFQHKLLFHVPITINFKSEGVTKFNDYTLNYLRGNKEDINIIGIDRGERNLIYVSVINQKGENICPPKHFNIVESDMFGMEDKKRKFNYLEKLKQKEGNRDDARKNWSKIETIKDLKIGYLSFVVHEIAKLVIEHHAIVVLEDLNYGFKRGRFNVERQIYQNFEKMLIEKLNFLVFKNNSFSPDYGNILNGLQLTAPFGSFKELGKQSGWLFYVNASYTSKIDPQTGFANLFNMKDAKKDTKSFFEKFTEIKYEDGMFKFKFDYRNGFSIVQTDYKNIWTVCTNDKRILVSKDDISGKFKHEYVDITESIKKICIKNDVTDYHLISKEIILSIKEKKFFDDLFFYFKLTLQMRNSIPNSDVDYLISPVQINGKPFFDSRISNNINIADADANGAYHIALKGLYLIKNDFPTEKKGKSEYLKKISNEEWFEFAQKRSL